MRKRDLEFFEREFAHLREFMREQQLLASRHLDWLAGEMNRERAEQRAAMDKHFAEQARKTDDLARKTGDLITENQAQRAALFAILDRLGNGGAAAAG